MSRCPISTCGVERYFDVMVFTSAWGPGLSKQHPRGFEFVRSQLHPADGRFIHVGDNPAKDFIGPAPFDGEP